LRRLDSAARSAEKQDQLAAIWQITPVVKKELAKASALNTLEKLFRNNLIRVDVCSIEQCDKAVCCEMDS